MPLPERGTLLAVDFGSARVGVAACDSGRVLAYPVTTLPAGEGIYDQLAALACEYEAVAYIVGYPLALDGRAGIAAEKIGVQARELSRRTGTPVWLVDERMTTAEAHRKLRATGRTAKTSRGVVDAQAAVGILESVLHGLNEGHTIGEELETKEPHG